jgi:hypothetical protein
MFKPRVSVLHGKAVHLTEATSHHVARLGGKCICCGEDRPEFLDIDWIDPTPDKLGGFATPGSFYAYLDRHPDIRVTVYCANCQHARDRFGVCPHQQQAGTMVTDHVKQLLKVAGWYVKDFWTTTTDRGHRTAAMEHMKEIEQIIGETL